MRTCVLDKDDGVTTTVSLREGKYVESLNQWYHVLLVMFWLRFRYVLDKWFQQSLLLWNPKERLRRGRYWNSGRRRRGGRLWWRVLSCFGICRICVAMFAQQNCLFLNYLSSSCFSRSVLFKKLLGKHLPLATAGLPAGCTLCEILAKSVAEGGVVLLVILVALVCIGFQKPKVEGQKAEISMGILAGYKNHDEGPWFILDSPTLSWEITSAIQWWSHFRFQWFYIWHMFFKKESTFNVSDLLLFLLDHWMVSHKTVFFTTCNCWFSK